MERTFVALKPDSVKRGLMGKIISRFEDKGYKIIAMKLTNVSLELAEKHYAEHVGKPFYAPLLEYITSGPVLAMVLEGENAILGVRHIVGKTNPDEADVGSIRADFCTVKEYNAVHASDSPESAKREMGLWFSENEICDNYKTMIEIVMGV
ncbi:MAG: nucleoside-diphosphate kinase [Candidatus Gastranaerophilales bacterium]|nr:nucleoside-diphosphate kinase [Candidatus Gastranaerophilales bacterium]